MSEIPAVAVLATLDTKGHEAEFLARQMQARGQPVQVIDIGLHGTPLVHADITRAEVMQAAHAPHIDAARDYQGAMSVVTEGAGAILRSLLETGRLAGVVALGGSKGTWMASAAMRQLPWGVPKMIVAATVPGDLRRYAGHSDMMFVSTVVDLAGLNGMTRLLLTRAAAMMAEAVSTSWMRPQTAGSYVAITMAGVVTECGQRVEDGLRRRGFEPIVFPANGIGGMAMEEMVQSGHIQGVVELALLELSNLVVGGICAAGSGRLESAGRRGLPQVVVPGATDFANFAGRTGVPARYRQRRLIDHTPAVTLMRLTEQESRHTGEFVGSKLTAAQGPTEVVIPRRGFSAYDQSGAPFVDEEADTAFINGLHSTLTGHRVVVTERNEHINDPSFAEAVVATFARLSARWAQLQDSPADGATKGPT